MTSERERLIETVSAMRDEDLLKMVYLESDQYRPEALTYAKAEIRQRGITFNLTDIINDRDSTPALHLDAFGLTLWRARRFAAFGFGFVSSLAWFAWVNFDSYSNMYKAHCYDCFVYFGFPFDLYQTGGFAGPTKLLWGGLIADVAIAMIVSAIVGLLLKIIVSRTTHSSNAV
jgi:hypothetical protein